ncbi:MAG TPA: PIN domain nuclease [Rugosimonospora sp.]|nr:PIN domain nuclease [Rugosimonospora sp.]
MAVARYLVDKSAHARLHRREVATVLDPLIQRGLVATCGTAALEFLYSAQSAADHHALNPLIDSVFEWLPTEDRDFQRARDISEGLAASGRHRAVGIADLIIAAVAERHRVTLLHYDADFDLIAQITGQPTEWVVEKGSVP